MRKCRCEPRKLRVRREQRAVRDGRDALPCGRREQLLKRRGQCRGPWADRVLAGLQWTNWPLHEWGAGRRHVKVQRDPPKALGCDERLALGPPRAWCPQQLFRNLPVGGEVVRDNGVKQRVLVASRQVHRAPSGAPPHTVRLLDARHERGTARLQRAIAQQRLARRSVQVHLQLPGQLRRGLGGARHKAPLLLPRRQLRTARSGHCKVVQEPERPGPPERTAAACEPHPVHVQPIVLGPRKHAWQPLLVHLVQHDAQIRHARSAQLKRQHDQVLQSRT